MILPAIKAIKLIKSTNFLLEKICISFLPIRAPIPTPTGMHPVKIPLAVYEFMVILKILIIYLN